MARPLLTVVLVVAACATAPETQPGGDDSPQARYPRRGAGCELTVYHTAVPGVPAWDDLGIAEVMCHINDSVAECLRRLRTEACRMGGDLLYNVPHRPLRPREQVLIYRGQVAHVRTRLVKKSQDEDLPPPASAEEAAGPVVPLPSAHRPRKAAPATTPANADGGAPADGNTTSGQSR